MLPHMVECNYFMLNLTLSLMSYVAGDRLASRNLAGVVHAEGHTEKSWHEVRAPLPPPS